MSFKFPQINDTVKRYSVIILSALGLLISLIIHFFIENGDNLAGCKVGSYFNCDFVINSVYGRVFGIPLSLLGAFYFLCLLAIYAVDFYDDYVIAAVAIVGILSIIDFVYIEFFLVNHFCLYCTSIHIIVIIIFIIIGPSAIKNSYDKLKLKYQAR